MCCEHFTCFVTVKNTQTQPAGLFNFRYTKLHDAARDAFREAIARADGVPARERADLYTNLGCALVELDKLEEALDAFRSAVEADPTHQNAAKNVLAMRSFLASSAA